MTGMLAALLLAGAFVYSGLDAAWQALDRVRLRHRADRGDPQARQMLAWAAVSPQADLVLAWTSHALAAGAFVALAAGLPARPGGVLIWAAPLIFIPVYALFVQLLARHVFRRLPFVVLSRLWWMVSLAGAVWAPLARPLARLLRSIPPDPLPQPPAEEELMSLAAQTEGISPLESEMLRSVMDFRHLTAGGLAMPLSRMPCTGADSTLAEVMADRALAEARHTLVIGGDGLPLGVMSAATAALSGVATARAQSFARPLLSLQSDQPAWKALAALRRSPTPVAEVRDPETGRFAGILTDQTVVARLLGQSV